MARPDITGRNTWMRRHARFRGCLPAWTADRARSANAAATASAQPSGRAGVLFAAAPAALGQAAATLGQPTVPTLLLVLLALLAAITVRLAACVWKSRRRLEARERELRKELASAHQALSQQAFHDALTALPNRANVLQKLAELLPRARTDGSSVAVMFVDLDGFKSINDTLGHEAGDEFLRRVGDALRASVRPRDTVARFGGDEFVIVLERYRGRANLGTICKKILALVGAPVLLGGHAAMATPSIGVAVFPDDGDDAASLLRHADIAMYAAKQRGKAGFCFYEPQMIRRAGERLALSSQLREALDLGAIEVHYQPKVQLLSRELVGLEALARWKHPDRGWLDPSIFIPLAEDCGLIGLLGDCVLRQVCSQLVQWRAQGAVLLPVAINLSMQEMRNPQFVPNLQRTMAEAGLRHDAIEFEITETAAMSDVDTTLQRLRELEKLGFALAIDDFGTGFSSLSHLRQLPARSIKIDQSFIHGAQASYHDREIAEAIIALARKLRLQTVAEGVENEEQARWLTRAGCHVGQGFLFGRPQEPAEVSALLAVQRSADQQRA